MFPHSRVHVVREDDDEPVMDLCSPIGGVRVRHQSLSDTRIVPSVEYTIFGGAAIGKTWKIVGIGKTQAIKPPDTVFIRSPMAYYGLNKELERFKAICHIPLFFHNTLEISVLICLKESVTTVEDINLEGVVSEVMSTLKNGVHNLAGDSLSRMDLRHRFEGSVVVFNEDWDVVGEYLATNLEAQIHQHIVGEFEVLFLASNMGYAEHFNGASLPSQIKPCEAIIVCIWCCLHFSIPNHILWWKTDHLLQLYSSHSLNRIARVGALCGLGNTEFKTEIGSFKVVSYENTCLEHIRRNNSRLLASNDITFSIARAYTSMLHRTKWTKAQEEKDIAKGVEDGTLYRMLMLCAEEQPSTVPARLRAAFVLHGTRIQPSHDIYTVHEFAMAEFKNLTSRHAFGRPDELLHPMKSSQFMTRHRNIIVPIAKTIQAVAAHAKSYREANDAFDSSVSLTLDRFWITTLYTANAILRFYCFGFFAGGFMSWIRIATSLRQSDYLIPKKLNWEWPFPTVSLSEGDGMVLPPQTLGYIPNVRLFTESNRCIEALRHHLEHLRTHHSLAASRQETFESVCRIVFDLLVSKVKADMNNSRMELSALLKEIWEYEDVPLDKIYLTSRELYDQLLNRSLTHCGMVFRIATHAMRKSINYSRPGELVNNIFVRISDGLIESASSPIRLRHSTAQVIVLPVGLGEKGLWVQHVWRKAFIAELANADIVKPEYTMRISTLLHRLDNWLCTVSQGERNRLKAECTMRLLAALIRGTPRHIPGVNEQLASYLSGADTANA